MSPKAADPYYRKAIRVAMGNTSRLPIVRTTAWPDDRVALRQRLDARIGHVAVQSGGASQGSTFTVTLPIASGSPDQPQVVVHTYQRASAKKVVVVDDNEDGAASLAELLRLLGNEVHLPRDGMEAIEITKRVAPDLILMDLGLPKLNALDATRLIRQMPWGRDVTIVALTGLGQQSDKELSRAAGCIGHLVKPVAMPDLQKILQQL